MGWEEEEEGKLIGLRDPDREGADWRPRLKGSAGGERTVGGGD